jgi:hypothetical protein
VETTSWEGQGVVCGKSAPSRLEPSPVLVKDWWVGPHEQVLNVSIAYWYMSPVSLVAYHQQDLGLSLLPHWLAWERNWMGQSCWALVAQALHARSQLFMTMLMGQSYWALVAQALLVDYISVQTCLSTVVAVENLCGLVATRLRTGKSVGNPSFEELPRTSHHIAWYGPLYHRVLGFCTTSAMF